MGTYVALQLSDCTKRQLSDYVRANNLLIPCDDWVQSLHVTLMYSSVDVRFNPPTDRVYTAEFESLEIFTPNDRRILVAKLKCDDLYTRHLDLENQYSLKHSFDEYIPHVTLSYEFEGDIQENLQPPNFTFTLHNEYVEHLDLLRNLK